jgi:hypothetical protein
VKNIRVVLLKIWEFNICLWFYSLCKDLKKKKSDREIVKDKKWHLYLFISKAFTSNLSVRSLTHRHFIFVFHSIFFLFVATWRTTIRFYEKIDVFCINTKVKFSNLSYISHHQKNIHHWFYLNIFIYMNSIIHI